MQNKRITIVEDDEITALNLKLSLKKQGYDVISVYDNAATAKNKMNTDNPDIVIIDISLQESNDGIELAKHIRKKHNIPFIFLTS